MTCIFLWPTYYSPAFTSRHIVFTAYIINSAYCISNQFGYQSLHNAVVQCTQFYSQSLWLHSVNQYTSGYEYLPLVHLTSKCWLKQSKYIQCHLISTLHRHYTDIMEFIYISPSLAHFGLLWCYLKHQFKASLLIYDSAILISSRQSTNQQTLGQRPLVYTCVYVHQTYWILFCLNYKKHLRKF